MRINFNAALSDIFFFFFHKKGKIIEKDVKEKHFLRFNLTVKSSYLQKKKKKRNPNERF